MTIAIFLAINLSASTIFDNVVELQRAQKGVFAMIFECKSEIYPNLPNISVILDHVLLTSCHNMEFRSYKKGCYNYWVG